MRAAVSSLRKCDQWGGPNLFAGPFVIVLRFVFHLT